MASLPASSASPFLSPAPTTMQPLDIEQDDESNAYVSVTTFPDSFMTAVPAIPATIWTSSSVSSS